MNNPKNQKSISRYVKLEDYKVFDYEIPEIFLDFVIKKNAVNVTSKLKLVKKNKNTNWLGVVAACVSLEIIDKTADELKSLNIPFGFKANLWGVEEPLPVHRFNNAGHNEVGKNPNITLGKREEVTGKVFCEFAKKIIRKGATILGGCCETDSSHIKELSKLK